MTSPWAKGYKKPKDDLEITGDRTVELLMWFRDKNIPPGEAQAVMAMGVAFCFQLHAEDKEDYARRKKLFLDLLDVMCEKDEARLA